MHAAKFDLGSKTYDVTEQIIMILMFEVSVFRTFAQIFKKVIANYRVIVHKVA